MKLTSLVRQPDFDYRVAETWQSEQQISLEDAQAIQKYIQALGLRCRLSMKINQLESVDPAEFLPKLPDYDPSRRLDITIHFDTDAASTSKMGGLIGALLQNDTPKGLFYVYGPSIIAHVYDKSASFREAFRRALVELTQIEFEPDQLTT